VSLFAVPAGHRLAEPLELDDELPEPDEDALVPDEEPLEPADASSVDPELLLLDPEPPLPEFPELELLEPPGEVLVPEGPAVEAQPHGMAQHSAATAETLRSAGATWATAPSAVLPAFTDRRQRSIRMVPARPCKACSAVVGAMIRARHEHNRHPALFASPALACSNRSQCGRSDRTPRERSFASPAAA
jgi:hypothetical protein